MIEALKGERRKWRIGIKNRCDECKRVSASLALVLTLSLLLLVGAVAPVQAEKRVDYEKWISVATVTEAECTDEMEHTEYNYTEKPWDGIPLIGRSKAKAWKSQQTWAEASVVQYVTDNKTWAKSKAEAQAAPGEYANASGEGFADPVASGAGWITIIIIVIIILLLTATPAYSTPARGNGATAEVNITVYDKTLDTTIWNGWAKSTPGHFEESGTWPKEWTVGPIGASYPRDTISKEVPEEHEIHAYLEVKASVNGGGWAKAMTISPVGGTAFPLDKLGLMAPYIALAIAVVAVALGAVSARKRWLGKAVLPKP